MTWFKIYYRKWRKKSPWKHIWDICGRFYSHKIYKTMDFDDVRIRTQSYKSYLIFYFSNDNKWWQYNEFGFSTLNAWNTLIKITRKILIFQYVDCNEKYFFFCLKTFIVYKVCRCLTGPTTLLLLPTFLCLQFSNIICKNEVRL